MRLMQKYYVPVVGLMIFGMLGLWAASATDTLAAKDTVEPAVFTPYSKTVATSSDFEYYDGLKTIDGIPYTGVVLDLYPDGSKKSRYSLKDGKAQGIWLDWHSDGAISYYGEWRDGRGNGPFIYFHPNGEVRERTAADEDTWTGPSEGWNADGTKAFERLFHDGVKTSEFLYPSG